jgi:DedD protein
MDQRLKQRLIGAVVLVALGVIFIPMFLQGPIERESSSVPIEIPVQPAIGTRSQPLPEPRLPAAELPVAVDPAPQQTAEQPVQTPVAREKPAAVPPKPVAVASQVPPELASWAVQVGSFGTEANALGLRDSLRAKGYKAYTETIRSDGKTLYRVRVGPTVERGESEKLQATLASKESLKGLVVPHP